jgi:hypothetical protein
MEKVTTPLRNLALPITLRLQRIYPFLKAAERAEAAMHKMPPVPSPVH